ncbi:hypothetical protein HYALB_00008337, partial [Hymenoscyphus albidus]
LTTPATNLAYSRVANKSIEKPGTATTTDPIELNPYDLEDASSLYRPGTHPGPDRSPDRFSDRDPEEEEFWNISHIFIDVKFHRVRGHRCDDYEKLLKKWGPQVFCSPSGYYICSGGKIHLYRARMAAKDLYKFWKQGREGVFDTNSVSVTPLAIFHEGEEDDDDPAEPEKLIVM